MKKSHGSVWIALTLANAWHSFLSSESSSVCHNLHLHHRGHSGRVSGTKNGLLHRQSHLPRQLSLCHLCSQHAPPLLWPGPLQLDLWLLFSWTQYDAGTRWGRPGYCVFSLWGKRNSLFFQSLFNNNKFPTRSTSAKWPHLRGEWRSTPVLVPLSPLVWWSSSRLARWDYNRRWQEVEFLQCTMRTLYIPLYPKLPCIWYRGIIEFPCIWTGIWA